MQEPETIRKDSLLHRVFLCSKQTSSGRAEIALLPNSHAHVLLLAEHLCRGLQIVQKASPSKGVENSLCKAQQIEILSAVLPGAEVDSEALLRRVQYRAER